MGSEMCIRDRPRTIFYTSVCPIITFYTKLVSSYHMIESNGGRSSVLSLKRNNYGPFYHDVVKKMPKGMNLWDFECILSKETLQSKMGKKFYVMHFAPQFGSPISMDQMTYDSLAHITGLITSENKRIDEAYKKVLEIEADEEAAAQIMDAVDTLEADYQVA